MDVCIDSDGDGHGFQCEAGEDCDDADATIFEGCMACSKPNEGCECDSNAEPADCTVSKEVTAAGTLLCKTGTRYCRDGVWSGCEGITSFEAPPPSRLLANTIIDGDAAPVICTVCSPDCYKVSDPLGSSNDASLGSNVVPGSNGGITLSSYQSGDGGVYDAGLLDDEVCTPGVAPDIDCDGIPDDYDPYPSDPPFASDHSTIFMDLAPGDQQSQSFDIRFFLNTADIYLYLDMTGSMGGELTNLITSLKSGNFLTNGGSGIECADRNFDGSTTDEEHLKNEGVAGNIACLIRDSYLGAGWHRDIPFPKPDQDGFAYGPFDFEAFTHEQDLTGDIEAVFSALNNNFEVRGGINRPEGGIMGLYSLATGAEIYTGWDRPGNPARTDCPTGTWGYPCFRDNAVPIVIWMTDAPVSNGPVPTQGHMGPANNVYGTSKNQPVNWGSQALGTEEGSDGHLNGVGKTHETFATALDVGNINDSFRTYAGSTVGMASNITYATAGVCGSGRAWSSSAQGAPDAVFKLKVAQAEPLTISTRGSRIETTLMIVDTDRIDGPNATTAVSANASPTTSAYLGSLSGVLNATGTAYGATAAFSRDSLGCLTNTTSSDKIAASVLRFNLANDVPQLRIVSDAPYALATSLFSARPGVPSTDINLSSMSLTFGVSAKTGNANDTFGQYNVGDMTGQYKRFINGDLTDSDLTSNFAATTFSGHSDCSGLTGTGKDAVFDFSLSAPTRLRIEGTGNTSLLQASFEHAIGLVQHAAMTPITGITNNYSDSTAYVIAPSAIPTTPYSWMQYSGTLNKDAQTTYLQSEVGPFANPVTSHCTYAAGSSGAVHGVFVMDVATTQSYDFDTSGSSVNTWLSIHKDLADTQRTVVSTNTFNDSSTGQAMPTPLDEISFSIQPGSLQTHGTTAATFIDSANFGCAAGTGGRDVVYSFTVTAAQTISATVGSSTGTTLAPGDPGFNSNIAIFRNSITATNRIAGGCADPNTGGNSSSLTDVAVSPGNTYYVVVKSLTAGTLTSTTGQYSLWLRDTTFSTHFQVCDYGSQVNNSATVRAAKLTRTLDPGKYYIVVKGATTGAAYQLNVRRTATNPVLRTCDHDRLGTRHSMIEDMLPAGNYSLIVRGWATGVPTSGNGAFNLIFRDMGVAPDPLTCGYDANTTNVPATPFTTGPLAARDGSGNPIDYYLVMRGNTSAGSGTSNAYTIRVEDSAINPTECAYDSVTMSYTQASPYYAVSTDLNNAEWTGTLPVGDYYVVLKGYNTSYDTLVTNDDPGETKDRDTGMYQLTVGDQINHERVGSFASQRWLGAAGDGATGVRKALLDRNIRVITVDSTTGSGDSATYSDQQLRTIASSTEAVALDGSALFFKISSNGTGLGSAIVNAVNLLAGNLAMDVGVRLVEEPDSPAPRHFNFLVRAIDQPGDLCATPVDTDGDAAHTPDTHRACTPGAVPRFEVTFKNPTPPNNVPSNPADPNGGWNMRLELIGDNQYVVDQIPVYIIPEDVVETPGEDRYNPSGVYEQPVSAAGCIDTEAPLWKGLEWDATIPSGTSLVWSICTADTLAALASCTPQTVATVITGGSCLEDVDCPNGYCNSGFVCEYATGPSCSEDVECGVNGDCVTGTCLWNNNPIDVKPAIVRGMQGNQHARVTVTLVSNTARTRAPTVNSWALRYTCTAQE